MIARSKHISKIYDIRSVARVTIPYYKAVSKVMYVLFLSSVKDGHSTNNIRYFIYFVSISFTYISMP